MAKVSVIIPTYNRDKFISDTINSVLEQTYKDFEIIVVDDGSTDSTLKVLEQFGTKIKLIKQPNLERAVARNNGVKNSNGKYIAFLDSDDLWAKEKLEKQVEILDQNEEIILTYCSSGRINEKGQKIKTAKRQMEGFSGKITNELLLRNFVVSATPLLRREYFDKTGGFKSQYIPYEDWEFWVRLSLLGKFYFINKPLAYYRIHDEQSVQLVKAEKIEQVTLSLLNDSFKLNGISSELQNRSLGLANLRFSYWYLLVGKYDIAKEKIKEAIKLNPSFAFDPRWYGLKMVCEFPQLKEFVNLEGFH